jgi:hypothetical protein
MWNEEKYLRFMVIKENKIFYEKEKSLRKRRTDE